jgi:hypothetical protein
MKIDFKKIPKKYIALVLVVLGYYIWTIPPAEVRPIIAASKIVKAEYEQNIKQAMLDGKEKVYLKDMINSVKWDKVYSYSYDSDPYENSREMLHKITGKDYPISDSFDSNDELEESIIFMYKNDIVAFIVRNDGSFINLTNYKISAGNFIDNIGFPNCKKCDGKLIFYGSFAWQNGYRTCSLEQADDKNAKPQKCSLDEIETNECCVKYIGE